MPPGVSTKVEQPRTQDFGPSQHSFPDRWTPGPGAFLRWPLLLLKSSSKTRGRRRNKPGKVIFCLCKVSKVPLISFGRLPYMDGWQPTERGLWNPLQQVCASASTSAKWKIHNVAPRELAEMGSLGMAGRWVYTKPSIQCLFSYYRLYNSIRSFVVKVREAVFATSNQNQWFLCACMLNVGVGSVAPIPLPHCVGPTYLPGFISQNVSIGEAIQPSDFSFSVS